MTEQQERIANELENVLNQFSENVNKILGEMFTLKGKTKKDWKMKCPYAYGDNHYCIQSSGDVFLDSWKDIEADNSFFSQGNIFPTREAAELESKRRNLLTRFRAFKNECNRGLSVQDEKWEIDYKDKKLKSLWVPNSINGFPTFGYFKNREYADRAIELFGD